MKAIIKLFIDGRGPSAYDLYRAVSGYMMMEHNNYYGQPCGYRNC